MKLYPCSSKKRACSLFASHSLSIQRLFLDSHGFTGCSWWIPNLPLSLFLLSELKTLISIYSVAILTCNYLKINMLKVEVIIDSVHLVSSSATCQFLLRQSASPSQAVFQFFLFAESPLIFFFFSTPNSFLLSLLLILWHSFAPYLPSTFLRHF